MPGSPGSNALTATGRTAVPFSAWPSQFLKKKLVNFFCKQILLHQAKIVWTLKSTWAMGVNKIPAMTCSCNSSDVKELVLKWNREIIFKHIQYNENCCCKNIMMISKIKSTAISC